MSAVRPPPLGIAPEVPAGEDQSLADRPGARPVERIAVWPCIQPMQGGWGTVGEVAGYPSGYRPADHAADATACQTSGRIAAEQTAAAEITLTCPGPVRPPLSGSPRKAPNAPPARPPPYRHGQGNCPSDGRLGHHG